MLQTILYRGLWCLTWDENLSPSYPDLGPTHHQPWWEVIVVYSNVEVVIGCKDIPCHKVYPVSNSVVARTNLHQATSLALQVDWRVRITPICSLSFPDHLSVLIKYDVEYLPCGDGSVSTPVLPAASVTVVAHEQFSQHVPLGDY